MDTDPVKLIDVLSQERDDEHLARSRAEDERDHLRAEVERLRALVARQHEALELWAAIPNPERTHVRCAYCAVSVPANRLLEHTPGCVLSDPDGQRAAEEWDALVEVQRHARRISTYPRAIRRDEAWYGLGDALREYDRLRAVQEGKGEGDEPVRPAR